MQLDSETAVPLPKTRRGLLWCTLARVNETVTSLTDDHEELIHAPLVQRLIGVRNCDGSVVPTWYLYGKEN